MRAATFGFSLLFIISVVVVLAIEFLAYPSATTSNDPDRIEAPAFFVMQLAALVAFVAAVLVLISVFLQFRLKRFKASIAAIK